MLDDLGLDSSLTLTLDGFSNRLSVSYRHDLLFRT